ncbi:MAG: hypothetical protein KGP14_00965 [Betaproteobacteria bacterium]|nr:hypothetical protein [Betaproteobacteria bacterium]
MKNEYPKMLYGPKGWDDLSDSRLVADADEEEKARSEGYDDLGPVADEANSAAADAAGSAQTGTTARRVAKKAAADAAGGDAAPVAPESA